MEAGRFAAGSGRAELPHRGNAMGFSRKLDPFSLPVRFTAPDEAADERLRVVDLHRERVVLRRSVRGVRMALNLPVAAFRGVAIRMVFADAETAPTSIAVVLEHGDPALSLPLFSANECDDIVAGWQSWGRVLGLPLMPKGGWPALSTKLVERIIAALERHTPHLRERIVGLDLRLPQEEEPFSAARLAASYAERVSTPIEGLFLCGIGAEPMNAISARAGRLAAGIAQAWLAREKRA